MYEVVTLYSIPDPSIPILLSGATRSKPITSENKVYDKIIKALYLEVGLRQAEDPDTIELTGYAPDKAGESGIVQDAIDKYTTADTLDLSGGEIVSQQMAISDKSMKFEPFYHAMVTDATKLILPNTKKTSEELERLWDGFIAQYKRIIDPEDLSDLGYGDQHIVYQLKEEPFKYPTKITDATLRETFHDNLKKDVMLIKAAFLQSYLIREEQNQKGAEDTKLYRIQAIDTANILDLHLKEVGMTFCNKRSRITRAMDSRTLN